jgi:hypothetical protein
VLHLFKGGLILESLLKQAFRLPNGEPYRAFGGIFHDPVFKREFVAKVETNADDLKAIYKAAIGKNDLQTALNTTAQLRNTTGHDLAWEDNFTEAYGVFFEQEVNAVLYVLEQQFLVKSSGVSVG